MMFLSGPVPKFIKVPQNLCSPMWCATHPLDLMSHANLLLSSTRSPMKMPNNVTEARLTAYSSMNFPPCLFKRKSCWHLSSQKGSPPNHHDFSELTDSGSNHNDQLFQHNWANFIISMGTSNFPKQFLIQSFPTAGWPAPSQTIPVSAEAWEQALFVKTKEKKNQTKDPWVLEPALYHATTLPTTSINAPPLSLYVQYWSQKINVCIFSLYPPYC